MNSINLQVPVLSPLTPSPVDLKPAATSTHSPTTVGLWQRCGRRHCGQGWRLEFLQERRLIGAGESAKWSVTNLHLPSTHGDKGKIRSSAASNSPLLIPFLAN